MMMKVPWINSKRDWRMFARRRFCISVCRYFNGFQSECCTKDSVLLPFFHSINFFTKLLYSFLYSPRYSSSDAVGDLVAGITVGLTVIPQALAYSGIAGLPPAVNTSFILIVILLTEKKTTKKKSHLLYWISVRFVRFIHGLLCVHTHRFMQGCTNGSDRIGCTAYIPSGWRCLATGRATLVPHGHHRNTDGRSSVGLHNWFCFGTGWLWIHQCGGDDYFVVASQRSIRYAVMYTFIFHANKIIFIHIFCGCIQVYMVDVYSYHRMGKKCVWNHNQK